MAPAANQDPATGAEKAIDWPELTLPAPEAEHLRRTYREARVLLEYGSGGSTVVAAQEAGKLIFSVESDRSWAMSLQHKIDSGDLPSQAILHYVDIGETGRWGRPKNNDGWRHFHRYPTGIWSEPFFRQPDVVLIDGRLRPACFVTCCLRTKRPLKVLFDDYGERPMYRIVEEICKPTEIVGRMAAFEVTPREWPSWTEDLLMELCTLMSYDADEVDYSKIPDIAVLDMVGAKKPLITKKQAPGEIE